MVSLSKAGPLDYIRFVLSALLLLFSMVVTSYAIIEKKTNFWKTVPGWAAILLFILDLFILGIVEGLQIALVELKRQHPDAYKNTHRAAYRLGCVALKGDNVERFLMGRQVCVVFLVFFAAKLTTIHLEEDDKFLFPAPFWFRSVFLETGILACIVVVIIAQLMPQIVAAKYPVHFLQICIMKPAYYSCVVLEATGLTHICWLLSSCWSRVMGMNDDATTVNPNEALEKLESSLESAVSNHTNDSKDCAVELSGNKPTSAAIGPFGKLVEKIQNEIDSDALQVLRHFLNTHPEKFAQFPSVIGDQCYPAPHMIAERIRKDGYEVPRFLTDISDPNHVPPHIVACELLSTNLRLQEEIALLKLKLGSV